MSAELKVTGSCYCGSVCYEIAHEPSHVDVCHCKNCRRITGGQTVAWAIFPKDYFRYVKGEPRTYRSETQATWSFCPSCGTTLNYQSVDRLQDIDVVLVTLDDPAKYPPRGNSNADEKLPWVATAPAASSQSTIACGRHLCEHGKIDGSRFHDVSMAETVFDDVNLQNSTFHNINLSGTKFDDVNLSNVEITNVNITGLRIEGVAVEDLLGK